MLKPVNKKKSDLWIESVSWDLFWIFNGFWLVLILYFFNLKLNQIIYFSEVLSTMHLIAPIMGCFFIFRLTKYIKKNKFRYVIWPIFWSIVPAVIFFIIFKLSQSVLKYNVLYLSAIIYLLWTHIHGAGQHFGLLSIYRIKSNVTTPKIVDQFFSYGHHIILIPLCYGNHWIRLINGLGLVKIDYFFSSEISKFIIIASLVSVATVIACDFYFSKKISVSRFLYILMVGLLTAMSAYYFQLYFWSAIMLSHWMIEIGLTSKVFNDIPNENSSPLKYVNNFYIFFAVIFLISICIYLYFKNFNIHFLLNNLRGVFDHKELDQQSDLWLPISLYYSLNFMHFIYDRYLYAFNRSENLNIRNVFFKN